MSRRLGIEEVFALVRRAEWAGDVEYFRARLGDLRQLTTQTRGGDDWRPPALLRRAGDALEAHSAGHVAPPPELVPKTTHLRGVVWQTGRREFELRAYVTDLSWVESLYFHARKAAAASNVIVTEPDDEETEEPENVPRGIFFQDIEQAPLVDEGEGISWEEDAEGLLCTVMVSELGLIKVRGVWTGNETPEGADVVRRLTAILERIESPDQYLRGAENSRVRDRKKTRR
jgi:hypothetical protein